MLCFDVLMLQYEDTESYRQSRNINEDPKESCDGQRPGGGSSKPESKDGVLMWGGGRKGQQWKVTWQGHASNIRNAGGRQDTVKGVTHGTANWDR